MSGLYDAVSGLPLRIADTARTRRERDTSSGFRRATTTFHLRGDGVSGRGEDVSYDTKDHKTLESASAFDLQGRYGSFAAFSEYLDDIDLFPRTPPTREAARHYRRWALESAALDLALKQNDRSLGEAVGRTPSPLRFVVSTRLGDPTTTDRVEELLGADPGAEFKLDPTTDWTDELVDSLAETGAVRIVDLKGHYEGTDVDQAPDPDLYERVLRGFPDAVVEDPALTEATRPLFDGEEGRVSWDAPITGMDSVRELPFEPSWLNVKPSRFGTVESLFETIEYAESRGISLYGGGQFELDVGRDHIQLLASLFYPEGPNDVAPSAYNDPALADGLPTSPLDAPRNPAGLDWA